MDVDPKGDATNYQTEIMVEIEKRPFRVIADSGATFLELYLKVVRTWSTRCCQRITSIERPLGTSKRHLELFLCR
jgi:hypothetical protein